MKISQNRGPVHEYVKNLSSLMLDNKSMSEEDNLHIFLMGWTIRNKWSYREPNPNGFGYSNTDSLIVIRPRC